jgi:hypothetical protein
MYFKIFCTVIFFSNLCIHRLCVTLCIVAPFILALSYFCTSLRPPAAGWQPNCSKWTLYFTIRRYSVWNKSKGIRMYKGQSHEKETKERNRKFELEIRREIFSEIYKLHFLIYQIINVWWCRLILFPFQNITISVGHYFTKPAVAVLFTVRNAGYRVYWCM